MSVSKTAILIGQTILKEKMNNKEANKFILNYFEDVSEATDYLNENGIYPTTLKKALNYSITNKKNVTIIELAKIQLLDEVIYAIKHWK